MFTRHAKNMVSTAPLAGLISIVVDPDSSHSTSLPKNPSFPALEMDTYVPSDLDLPITLRKGRQSTTMHHIFNFVYYNHLIPLSHQFFLSVSFVFILKSY